MNIEKEKKKVELLKVSAALGEQKLRILEKGEEIKRLQESVYVQEEKIKELELLITSMEGE